MKGLKKKALSALLTLAMVVGMLQPMAVEAADTALSADKIKAVTVSGTFETSTGGENDTDATGEEIKALVFDNNPGTYWNSNSVSAIAEGNPYLTVELDDTYSLTQVDYTPRWHAASEYWACTGNIKKLVVEVSKDGTTWEAVTPEGGADYSDKVVKTNNASYFPAAVKFDAVEAKYVRISGTESYHWQSPNTSITVGDLAVYGDEIVAEPVALAADEIKTVQVSGTFETSTGGENDTDATAEEIKAVVYDNDPATFWNSNSVSAIAAGNPYLTFELDGIYSVSKVNYSPRWHGASEYWKCTGNIQNLVVEVSADGAAWETVTPEGGYDLNDKIVKENNYSLFPAEVAFEAKEARYVRISGTESYHWQSPNTSITVGAVEIWGNFVKDVEEPVTPEVDKTALEDAKSAAAALTEADYTTESWAVLTAALAAADALAEDADQATVDAAAKAITDAIAALEAAEEEGGEEAEVHKLAANEIRTMTASSVTETSDGEGITSITSDKLKSLLLDGDAFTFWRSQIGAKDSIKEGNPYLEVKLDGIYDLTKIEYTPRQHGTSFEVTGNIRKMFVQTSKDGVNWTTVNGEGTAIDLTTATFPLAIEFDAQDVVFVRISGTEAYHWDNNLLNSTICVADLALYGSYVGAAPVDRSALTNAINEAKALNEIEYEAEGWAAVEAALAKAEAVAEDADQATVDAAANELTAALEALVKIKPMQNAKDYLDVPTYTASGKRDGEAVHPDIVDMSEYPEVCDEDGKWNGYRYYMATTPNQNGNSQFENPCLVASNDGITWETPAGITNPLTNVKEEPQPYHNCDADMVYNDQTDELYLYYVWAKDSPGYGQSGFQPMEVRLFKIGYDEETNEFFSVNGTEPQTVITTTYRYDLLSPTIVKTGENEWKMWSVNTKDQGWNNQSNVVEYRVSRDGITWSEPVSLKDSFVQPGYYHWHIDVNMVDTDADGVDDEYWAIYPAYPHGGGSNYTELFYAKSEDGLVWTTYENQVLIPDSSSWDCNFIYRSTFLWDTETDMFRLWYSAGANGTDGWRIAYTENEYSEMVALLGETSTPDVEAPEVPAYPGVSAELKAAIDQAKALKEADYTAETWAAVATALAAAEALGEDATDAEITAATATLLDAIAKLEKAPTEEPDTPVVEGGRVVYLSDIEWTDATVGSYDNDIRLDLAYAGSELTLLVDGEQKTFEKGIGTHATSNITYDIAGKGYTTFEAWAGVDYSRYQYYMDPSYGTQYGVIQNFSVSIDGKVVAQSGEMNPASDAYHFQVDIPADAQTLVLSCTSGDKTWADHADWADAKFIQEYPDPTNVALAELGTTAKTYVNPADGDDYEYNATEFGGNTDSTVQIGNINDGMKTSSQAGAYYDFGRDSEKNSIYVELDLGQSYELASVDMWRYWLDGRTYDATVVVVSDDADFSDSTIIYNSDTNNVHGLGAGADEKYAESAEGHSFAVPAGTTAQYVRVYTYGVYNGGNTNHIVELEVNAYVWDDGSEEETEGYPNPFKNAENPLDLEGPGTNGEVVHPDVVVFDEPWNGYRFWMGYTPNKTGTSYYENPCIAASHDEVNWEVPEGLTNPVQPRFDSAVQNELEHNCDTDLLYDEVNDRLILYWEWAQDEAVTGSGHRSEIRYRVSYDGVNWGIPVEGKREVTTGDEAYGVALATDGERYSDLSPTFVYDAEEEIYKMWANDAGNGGYNNPTKAVWYLTSEDPLCFSEARVKADQGRTYVNNLLAKDENGVQMLPWHLDVQWIPEMEEYWAITQAFPNTGNPDNSSVRLSKSTDGINWTPMVDAATGNSKPILSPAETGKWDDGQIYRTTFWYEPSETGAKNGGTLHLWYSALSKKPDQHWEIGYTSANYRDAMAYLTGTKPDLGHAANSRLIVDNEHPLLIVPVYCQDAAAGKYQWDDTLVGRWESIPDDIKPYTIMEIHSSNAEHGKLKAFYESQLEIAEANNIPCMIVTVTAGQYYGYTATTDLDNAWLEEMIQTYSCLKGFISTENYWIYSDTVAAAVADHLTIAAENGGYMIWYEHQSGIIEAALRHEGLRTALEKYGTNFSFTWKNTPARANQNATTSAYMQGLWLAGVIDQWGGLMDTWKWYEKGFGKLFAGNMSYANNSNGADEECRAVVMEPEALLGIEMLSIYANGGAIYSFEHPAYTQGIANENTPLFENVIYENFKYFIENPAPSKAEVLADTEVFIHGNLSSATGLHTGITSNDQTLPAHSSGRYGLLPAVPANVSVDDIPAEKVVSLSTLTAMSKDELKTYLNERYTDGAYEGDAFAQKVDNTWFVYNSKTNEDVDQSATISVDGQKVKVDMEPHTYAVLEAEDGNISVYYNNYRVNKDEIWDGYTSTTQKWDPDVNHLLEDWLADNYMTNTKDEADTYRTTTFTLTDLTEEPVVNVTNQKEEDFVTEVTYDAETGTAVIKVTANGYVYFTISEDADVPTVADKSELEAAVAAAEALKEEDYTADSWAAADLAAEITAAKAVLNNADATQAEVDAAVDALEAAVAKLEEKAEEGEVVRISGTDRYATGYKAAEALKETLGVDKFDAVVVATGKNFADALSGSYLAIVKEAPILLTNGKDDNVADLHAYIKENVNANGTVYILGGTAAVPATVEAIEGYTVKRLAGSTRYETNLDILAEAGITGTELIVATGKEFADSLSASATGRPILLVKPGAALSAEQKAVVETVKDGNIYVVGGTGAVAETTAAELEAYAAVERIAGAGRQETSKKIAEKFFADADSVVVANAKNFPDGLCGGPLAAAMGAPLLLTATGNTTIAEGYVQGNALTSGVVLGGTGALSDEAVVDVFALESADEIVLK